MALKAYSYTESENLNAGVHDRVLLEREKLMAADFVDSHQYTYETSACPFCNSEDTEKFAVIGGAQYYRCKSCWSIFTPVCDEIIKKYREYAPLINLRQSKEYQEAGKRKRQAVWDEQLFWIQFRSIRYLKQLSELRVMELGGRYEGFSEKIKSSCAAFTFCKSISELQGLYDAVIYFGVIMQEPNPADALRKISRCLSTGGLLFLNARVSTGYDILTLKGNVTSFFPYDCTSVPSVEAIELILNKSGFDILEISTPGSLDVRYVTENSSNLERNDLFSRYLVEKSDEGVRAEFQRFLQKSMISSHAQIVARVKS